MTQEEKELLLKDLCARLPYEVAIAADGLLTPQRIVDIDFDKEVVVVKPKDRELIAIGCLGFEDFKPYLRPMSSMTEEEKNELKNLLWFGYPSDDYDNNSHRGIEIKQCLYDDERYSIWDFDDFRALQNFLLKNHFDYRGLIEKGLALEAPKGMYNF